MASGDSNWGLSVFRMNYWRDPPVLRSYQRSFILTRWCICPYCFPFVYLCNMSLMAIHVCPWYGWTSGHRAAATFLGLPDWTIPNIRKYNGNLPHNVFWVFFLFICRSVPNSTERYDVTLPAVLGESQNLKYFLIISDKFSNVGAIVSLVPRETISFTQGRILLLWQRHLLPARDISKRSLKWRPITIIASHFMKRHLSTTPFSLLSGLKVLPTFILLKTLSLAHNRRGWN